MTLQKLFSIVFKFENVNINTILLCMLFCSFFPSCPDDPL